VAPTAPAVDPAERAAVFVVARAAPPSRKAATPTIPSLPTVPTSTPAPSAIQLTTAAMAVSGTQTWANGSPGSASSWPIPSATRSKCGASAPWSSGARAASSRFVVA
jgi:hypothetical protein